MRWSDGEVANVVNHVLLPIIRRHMCNSLYRRLSPEVDVTISSDMLCAGYRDGGRDACQVRIACSSRALCFHPVCPAVPLSVP